MRFAHYGCLLAVLAAINPVAHAVDGEYDPSWAGNGRVRLDISPDSDHAEAIVIQADGKVVVAGTCGGNSYCAARLLPNGSYDAGFGNGATAGRFVYGAAGSTFRLTAAGQAADGGLVLAGTNYTAATQGRLIKLDPAGSQVMQSSGLANSDFGGNYHVNALAVQADGRIVVAGTASSTPGSHDMVVARFLPDLTADASFGDAGHFSRRIRFQNRSSEALAVAVQANGKIVVAGVSVDRVAVVRLLANGQLDDDPVTGFGDGGRLLLACGLQCRALAVALDRDGSVFLGGAALGNTGPNPSYDFFLNRLTARGVQSPEFGLLCPIPLCQPGPVYFDWGNRDDVAFAMAVQSDGRILLSGFSVRGAGAGLTEDLFAVARFDSTGVLDGTFGNGGQTRGWYGAAAGVDNSKAMAIGNGGIMIAGFSRDATTVDSRFGVAKLKLDLVFTDRFDP